MEGVDVENGSAIARPEADAATAAKEAAKQVVAAMSRRVRGIDKATGTVVRRGMVIFRITSTHTYSIPTCAP